jgi:hypothetical protein
MQKEELVWKRLSKVHNTIKKAASIHKLGELLQRMWVLSLSFPLTLLHIVTERMMKQC